jgi:hypothetical protein
VQRLVDLVGDREFRLARDVGPVQRQQQAQLRVNPSGGHSGVGQPSGPHQLGRGTGLIGLSVRSCAFDRGDDPERACNQRRKGEDRDQLAEPAGRPPLELQLPLLAGLLLGLLELPAGKARLHVGVLARRGRHARLAAPGSGQLETHPGQQVVLVPTSGLPVPRGHRDRPLDPQIVPALLDPALQPRPGPQQRLVRHLDGRRAGDLVAVEGQQPSRSEPIEHRLHCTEVVGQ